MARKRNLKCWRSAVDEDLVGTGHERVFHIPDLLREVGEQMRLTTMIVAGDPRVVEVPPHKTWGQGVGPGLADTTKERETQQD